MYVLIQYEEIWKKWSEKIKLVTNWWPEWNF